MTGYSHASSLHDQAAFNRLRNVLASAQHTGDFRRPTSLTLLSSLQSHGPTGSHASTALIQQWTAIMSFDGSQPWTGWGQAATMTSSAVPAGTAGTASAAQQAASPWPQRGPLQARKPPHASWLPEPGTAAAGGDIAPRRTPSSRLRADSRALSIGPGRAPLVAIVRLTLAAVFWAWLLWLRDVHLCCSCYFDVKSSALLSPGIAVGKTWTHKG